MTAGFDYSGRTVLVTGGTQGIGAGIAAAYQAAGANVVVCARKNPAGLPDLIAGGAASMGAPRDPGARPSEPGGPQAAGVTATGGGEPGAAASLPTGSRGAGDRPGGGPVFVAADVREPEQVSALAERIVERYGRLDVVVNNAGGGPYVPAGEASPRLHQRVIELNLLAPLHVAQAAYRVMAGQADGGSIVMIGSVSGVRPSPGSAAYGAAKAGLHHLAACLAAEWAPVVRVNSVVVGLADTGDNPAEHYGGPEAFAEVQSTVPAGRMARPEDVARACLFLTADPYITGASLTVDGGGEQPAWNYIVQHKH
jgi:NAD(P)-dependent dehydrogenase (short-subunit alcohol dehydrogenase family)